MKKVLLLIIILGIVLVSYSLIPEGQRDIEDALDIDSKFNFEIINVEQFDDDFIVFSLINSNSLHIGHLKKNSKGYRTVYSLVASDIDKSISSREIIEFVIPGLDNDSQYRYMGLISNDRPKEMSLIDASSKVEVETRITMKNDFIFWVSELDLRSKENVVAKYQFKDNSSIKHVEIKLSR